MLAVRAMAAALPRSIPMPRSIASPKGSVPKATLGTRKKNCPPV
jgi:hypothetical protein